MKTDVAGRVRNTSLAASRPLLPLYEAVVNSMEAIQNAQSEHGHIEITILRDKQNLFSEYDAAAGDVIGFQLTDNGSGSMTPTMPPLRLPTPRTRLSAAARVLVGFFGS